MKTTMTLLLLLLLLVGRATALLQNTTCVCAGNCHSCLISGVGDVVCWGRADYGRLGYGSTTNYFSPSAALAANPGGVQVTSNNTVAVVKIECGWDLVLSLLANGEARAWGFNDVGNLGLGHTQDVGDDEHPWQPPGGPVTLSGPVRDLCTAGEHSCAVMDSPELGRVACWGRGTYGRLGYGNTEAIGDDETVVSAGFVEVGGTGTVLAIFCGGLHTLALMSDAWGQLGLNHTMNVGDSELPSAQPAVVLGLGGASIEWISAGGTHSCVTTSLGQGKCWGWGVAGRLGTGNVNTVISPSSVGFIDFGLGELVVQLEAFRDHSCGLLASGPLKCFGRSGDPGMTGELLGCGWPCPNRLAPNETVTMSRPAWRVAVGCDAAHTIAIHLGGTFEAWGIGLDGQLGYGNTQHVGDDETPASVGNVNFSDGVTCAPPQPTCSATATARSSTKPTHTATRTSPTLSDTALSLTATLASATLATHSRTGITRTPRSRPATLSNTGSAVSATAPSRSSAAAASTSTSSPGSLSVLTFVLLGVGALVVLMVLCVALLTVFVVLRRRAGRERAVAVESAGSRGESVVLSPVEYAELVPPAAGAAIAEEAAQSTQYTVMPSTQASEYAQLPDKHKQALIAAGHVIDFEELQLGEKLGEGAFGVVYRGVWRRAPVAVKELKSFDLKREAEFEHEAAVHKRVPAHANVVQFLAVTCGARFCIMVEFVAGGSLEKKCGVLGGAAAEELVAIARGIARGMAHLHAHEVLHRDLAARNVLLSAEGVPKVTDFGMSRLVVTGEYVTHSDVLPLKWLSPETVQTRAFTKASDVWSYGVTLFECVTGDAPWPELSGFEVSRRVGHEGAVPEVPAADSSVASVMRRCFERDAKRRPSFVDVLGML